jgi:hypothetical protein
MFRYMILGKRTVKSSPAYKSKRDALTALWKDRASGKITGSLLPVTPKK